MSSRVFMFKVTERELPPADPLIKFINLPPCLIHSSLVIIEVYFLFHLYIRFRRRCRKR